MKETVLSSKSLYITLILVLLCFAGSSQPGSPHRPPQQSKEAMLPQPPPPPEICKPDPSCSHKLELPDLTAEQEGQLKELGTKHLQAMIPLKAQLAEKEAGLVILLVSDNPDNKKINDVIEEIGKLRTNIFKLAVDQDQAIRKILTPEQKVIFDQMPKKFLVMRD